MSCCRYLVAFANLPCHPSWFRAVSGDRLQTTDLFSTTQGWGPKQAQDACPCWAPFRLLEPPAVGSGFSALSPAPGRRRILEYLRPGALFLFPRRRRVGAGPSQPRSALGHTQVRASYQQILPFVSWLSPRWRRQPATLCAPRGPLPGARSQWPLNHLFSRASERESGIEWARKMRHSHVGWAPRLAAPVASQRLR